MSKQKKFGTFSGVFTPSILTILGVIMYLRFPAIIGQAGLINTIGIIVIAHIISITTSLSVASLSTDKPVQTGGTYFMISRSLGLPIGGTLGIALFVGLSFSVSLYLIGFAESFLQYWGLDSSIESIRISGSIALIAVGTLTFISTSLAIKSQYFIMAAIGLSLLSIFFGMGHHEFAPKEINFEPLTDAAPFMVLFGIFFPAVTGFEAGVSMSGDLKNPKKSLPYGVIMAVGIGLLVYLGLAFFYTYTVDAKALFNDPKILFKIALVPALVIAGIWGATLSSALGSILAAPRILQAISMDKIAPKIFAKGSGKTNEPRNALILAALIAEAGILIGELDLIARIVSMFFITTYGFLNLASAIESWSSSDYRPAFKIPRFVSILGAFSAFIVMVLLDFLALAGATVVLGLIYFFLQRKELILETGDAWSSFWTNLAKRALLKLSIQKASNRNWRPNIILFSGGEQVRPHLVEMGLSLSGKLGALTDFNLVTNKVSGHNEILSVEDDKKKDANFFKRHFECENIETGIQTVTSVYGFSGFEPNTVLMGWSKNSESADFLINILNDLRQKKMNAIFLDYDKNSGFGKKQNIDVWWNGKGRLLSFSLNILRFLQSDGGWRDAKVRILIVNNDTALKTRIYRNTLALLEEKRSVAEIKIIGDSFGSRTIESIISTESLNADLVLVGISPRTIHYTSNYIESINRIAELPASILILRPSDEFEEINLIDYSGIKEPDNQLDTTELNVKSIPSIENMVVKERLNKLDEDFLTIGNNLVDKTIGLVIKYYLGMVSNINEYSRQNNSNLEGEFSDIGKHELKKILDKNHHLFLRNINNIIHKQNHEIIDDIKDSLSNGISDFLKSVENYIYETPETIIIPYLNPSQKKEKKYKVLFQKLIKHYYEKLVIPELADQLIALEQLSVKVYADLRDIIFGINDTYEKLLLNPAQDENIGPFSIKQSLNDFDNIRLNLQNHILLSKSKILGASRELIIQIADDFSSPLSIKKLKMKVRGKHKINFEYFDLFPESLQNGVKLINNTLYLDTLILSQQKIFERIIQKCNAKIRLKVSEDIFALLNALLENIEISSNSNGTDMIPVVFPDDFQVSQIFLGSYNKITEILDELPEEILLPHSIYNNSIPVSLSDYIPTTSNLNKIANYYFGVLFYETFYREIQQLEIVINNSIIEGKEANSLLMFILQNIQNDTEISDFDLIKTDDFYKKIGNQLIKEKNKIEMVLLKIENSAIPLLQNSASKLFYHAIIESEKKISAQQREQTGAKLSTALFSKLKYIQEHANQLLINILNSTSSGIIYSKKHLGEKEEMKVNVGPVFNIVESLLPDKEVYEQIPIFYRTLLSSKSKINDELWVPMDEEFNLIKKAVERHQNGIFSNILIKGVRGAGKTTLARYTVNHLFKRNNIFWLNAPVNGSVLIDDFLEELRKINRSADSFEGIFNSLPFGSVLVIDDLELWWERSASGGEVLAKILELLDIYGRKVFFIINCNSHSFNIINKIIPAGDNFISIVDCNSFNTGQLQQLIMNRHKSSGLMLNYNGKSEDSLSQLSLSLLFNSFFLFTGGVPGIALNAWKANIIKTDAESIFIKKPEQPNVEILSEIDGDWLVLISLFIQHKNLDLNKLMRITDYESIYAGNLLTKLLNAGIIVAKGANSYCLGRNIEPFLVNLCIEKGII